MMFLFDARMSATGSGGSSVRAGAQQQSHRTASQQQGTFAPPLQRVPSPALSAAGGAIHASASGVSLNGGAGRRPSHATAGMGNSPSMKSLPHANGSEEERSAGRERIAQPAEH
jgi:hypothetical protein